MGTLLYYDDPYLSEFEASITDRRTADDGALEVALDRTAFYPEGGGQPSDIGTLGHARVSHVSKDNGVVWHRVDTDPGHGRLAARLDREHRFDYMQQHTGQHILSACFLDRAGLETVSVHQGEAYTTIEFNSGDLPADVEREIEDMANRIITEGRPVRTYWCEESEVPSLNLRRPPKVSGSIRIVEVDALDRVACGGVHAASTAEVSLVRVLGRERIRGRLRYSFLIGRRAHEHHRQSRDILARLGDLLSVPPAEVEARVQALEARTREIEYELVGARRELAASRAAGMVATARRIDALAGDGGSDKDVAEGDRYVAEGDRYVAEGDPIRGVTAVYDGTEAGELRAIAEALVEYSDTAFVLGSRTERGLVWLVGHGAGLTMDLKCLKAEAFPAIDAKGGGKAPLYQGKGAIDGDWQRFVGSVFSCVERNAG